MGRFIAGIIVACLSVQLANAECGPTSPPNLPNSKLSISTLPGSDAAGVSLSHSTNGFVAVRELHNELRDGYQLLQIEFEHDQVGSRSESIGSMIILMEGFSIWRFISIGYNVQSEMPSLNLGHIAVDHDCDVLIVSIEDLKKFPLLRFIVEVPRYSSPSVKFHLSERDYNDSLGLLTSIWNEQSRFRLARVANVASDDALNIRSQPDHRSTVVDTISFDAENLKFRFCQKSKFVTDTGFGPAEGQLSDSRTWCMISYQGVTGWVNSSYIQVWNGTGYMPVHGSDYISLVAIVSPLNQEQSRASASDQQDVEEHTGLLQFLKDFDWSTIIVELIIAVIGIPIILWMFRGGLNRTSENAGVLDNNIPVEGLRRNTTLIYLPALFFGTMAVLLLVRLSETKIPEWGYFSFYRLFAILTAPRLESEGSIISKLSSQFSEIGFSISLNFLIPLLVGLAVGIIWGRRGYLTGGAIGLLSAMLLWWPTFYLWNDVSRSDFQDFRMTFLGLYLAYTLSFTLFASSGSGFGYALHGYFARTLNSEVLSVVSFVIRLMRNLILALLVAMLSHVAGQFVLGMILP
jgi:Bacterial SH3 domain